MRVWATRISEDHGWTFFEHEDSAEAARVAGWEVVELAPADREVSDDRVFGVKCDELGPGLHDMVPVERVSDERYEVVCLACGTTLSLAKSDDAAEVERLRGELEDVYIILNRLGYSQSFRINRAKTRIRAALDRKQVDE